MKNIIIGTAGHIDHGKTTLIKAITGRDTDSLNEEKKRGISIDLGFAYFTLPSKRGAGIIDVPGHEKFIKNMLAGATGIDVVLLIIACDEGIKPQTKEHLDILSMLNLKKGIIVLTKVDLVDSEWISFMKEEIRDSISHTFLKDAKILEFSSKTNVGINELLYEIDNIIDLDIGKSDSGIFRMPIDRCFTVSGFGTVVTGTVISGSVKIGDNLCIYPKGFETKVRNIQVYEKELNEAKAGQRCALNLTNVKKEDIERGFVVSKKYSMNSSYIIDCKFYALKDIEKDIKNRTRIRIFHGSSEIIGRIHFLDRDHIKAGEEVYVQFYLENPITCLKDDRYVVRLYSPMITLGGGYIINPVGIKVKGNKSKYLDNVMNMEKEIGIDYVSSLLQQDKDIIITDNNFSKRYSLSMDETKSLLNKMVDNNLSIVFKDGEKNYYIHKDNVFKIYIEIQDILNKFHHKNRLKIGFLKEELKTKISIKNIKPKIYDKFLEYYNQNQFLKVSSKYVSLYDFNILILDEDKKIINSIINEYRKGRFIPPKIKDLNDLINSKDFFNIHNYMEDSGILYKICSDMYLLKEDFEFAKNSIIDFLNVEKSIDLKDAKELFNSNRKYIVYLLEHFDQIKITKRYEEKRILF